MMNDSLFFLLEHTGRSVFLTGKAGTGKTTFLNSFTRKTSKKTIVVAPTGIAAINAGGVTIHSMFGLPLRTFLPTTERIPEDFGNNIHDLHRHFKYRKDKLKLLREVEIIIIDEASMLRADVLDMMDFALRHIRRNQQRFGGVQMLFIGDLYQLPPVVRDEHILKNYYESPFFFDSLALKELPMVTVELTKVYRQSDEKFLKILNAIRTGSADEIDFEELNKRFRPDFEPEGQPYVYLTSHNRMADEINQKKLRELPGEAHFYSAKISGDFRENQFPNEETLELKIGAQVMFIRNDAGNDKRYFNGKLAEVTGLSDDEIYVKIEGSEEKYKLKREVWDQKKYSLDAEKKIQEEVLGSFEQFPIRLAWAVTIHKSQGLTFDRLIIDAGSSFASGQVYVALSRCRTLEGIILKSKITPEAIFSDNRVENFQQKTNANGRIEEILHLEKYDYAIGKIISRLNCIWMKKAVSDWYSSALTSKAADKGRARDVQFLAEKEADNLIRIYLKFEKILIQKNKKFLHGEGSWQELEEKAKGAVNFFFLQVSEKIYRPLKEFYAETKGIKGMKGFNEDFSALLDDLQEYLNDLKGIKLLDTPLFDPKNDQNISLKTEKIPTHILTRRLFDEGKTVSEIAKERGIMATTVVGHFSKFAEAGTLSDEDLRRIIVKEKIASFEKVYKTVQKDSLNEWKSVLPDDFDYGEIRLLWTFFDHKN